jgi:hypothetical protein
MPGPFDAHHVDLGGVCAMGLHGDEAYYFIGSEPSQPSGVRSAVTTQFSTEAGIPNHSGGDSSTSRQIAPRRSRMGTGWIGIVITTGVFSINQ